MIMISGANFTLRKGTLTDLDAIKALVDQHKKELGFVTRPALHESLERAEIFVAIGMHSTHITGIVHYRHRRDGQTTLYNLAVAVASQKIGIGHALVDSLYAEAITKKQRLILLKCPQVLPSNTFYKHYGFTCTAIEPGKKQPLNIWSLTIP